MDFLEYYGLKEEPFRLSPDPTYFFPSKRHTNGLLSLNYSTEQKEGFCLVTGEPGTGKTTLLNVFIETWKDRAEIAMVLTPRLSPEEFMISVLEDLELECPSENKNDILKAFRDFLITKSLDNKTVIILVDEAQNLPDETLEELRLLSNLETEKEKLLQIILIGQPELLDRLSSPSLRQLDQRIVTRILVSPLEGEEIRDYIHFRLSKAGRGYIRFDDAAIKKIYEYSSGTPRLINTITTRSMMSAFLDESNYVSVQHVRYALKSLDGGGDRARRKYSGKPALAYGLMSILLLVSFAFLLHSFPDFPEKEDSSVKTISKDDTSAPPRPSRARITTVAANVRETPSLGGKRILVLKRGETINLVDETFEYGGILWHRTKIEDVGHGWISSRVLKVIDYEGAVP